MLPLAIGLILMQAGRSCAELLLWPYRYCSFYGYLTGWIVLWMICRSIMGCSWCYSGCCVDIYLRE